MPLISLDQFLKLIEGLINCDIHSLLIVTDGMYDTKTFFSNNCRSIIIPIIY